MDAIQVAYIRSETKKKKDEKQKGLWDRQSNVEIVLYRYIRLGPEYCVVSVALCCVSRFLLAGDVNVCPRDNLIG